MFDSDLIMKTMQGKNEIKGKQNEFFFDRAEVEKIENGKVFLRFKNDSVSPVGYLTHDKTIIKGDIVTFYSFSASDITVLGKATVI